MKKMAIVLVCLFVFNIGFEAWGEDDFASASRVLSGSSNTAASGIEDGEDVNTIVPDESLKESTDIVQEKEIGQEPTQEDGVNSEEINERNVQGTKRTIFGYLRKTSFGNYILFEYEFGSLLLNEGKKFPIKTHFITSGNTKDLDEHANKLVMLTGYEKEFEVLKEQSQDIPIRELEVYYFYERPIKEDTELDELSGIVKVIQSRESSGVESYYYLELENGRKVFLAGNTIGLKYLIDRRIEVKGKHREGSPPSVLDGSDIFAVLYYKTNIEKEDITKVLNDKLADLTVMDVVNFASKVYGMFK